MLCDRCFGRARALLGDASDIVGRLRSLIDPTKAAAYNANRGGSAGPAGPDASLERLAEPIEAADQILRGLRSLSLWVEPDAWSHVPARHGLGPVASARSAEESASILLANLPRISNDAELAGWLGAVVLDVHAPDAHGDRVAWSVQDAASRWGAERRSVGEPAWEPEPVTVEEEAVGVSEWGDGIATVPEAAARFGVEMRTVQRWIKTAGMVPAATYREGRARRRFFRVSELLAARAAVEAKGKVA